MIQKTVNSNGFDKLFLPLSKKCKTLNQLKQIHAQILQSPFPQNPLALSPILSAAAKTPSFFAYARAIFDSLDRRNAFPYNTMIGACSRSLRPIEAVRYYLKMLRQGVKANNFTFPALIKACTNLGPNSAMIGRLVHAHVVQSGFRDDPYIKSALIEFYSLNLRDMRNARKVFDISPVRDVVLWTTMIDGYGKAGDMEKARELFDTMPERNTVSWSAIMAAYSRSSDFREVIRLFEQMQESGTKLNESILVSVLTACANLGAVTQGQWVHSYAKRNKLDSNPILATALIDMYSKCGLIDPALAIFKSSRERDVKAWNAMITGLSLNGRARKSLEIFDQMSRTDHAPRPNGTTFVAVLVACKHARMVEKGLEIFGKMEARYGVGPGPEHFACIVDLLGRAGMVEEAEKFVEDKMGGLGGGWDANVWGSLLGACRVHGRVEIGDRVWKKLVESGVSDCGARVVSYNIYREAGWESEAKRVRKMMAKAGSSKLPGCSVIEVNGVVEEFLAGDIRRSEAPEMVRTLNSLSRVVDSDDVFFVG